MGCASHWLAPPEAKIIFGWCQHPEADEEYEVEGSGGFKPYRDHDGSGDLRVSEGMCCERFVLIERKPKRQGSD